MHEFSGIILYKGLKTQTILSKIFVLAMQVPVLAVLKGINMQLVVYHPMDVPVHCQLCDVRGAARPLCAIASLL